MLFFKSKTAAFLVALTAFTVVCGCGNSAKPASAAQQMQSPETSSSAAKAPQIEPPVQAPPKGSYPLLTDNSLQSEDAPPEAEKPVTVQPAQASESERPKSGASSPSAPQSERAETVSQPMISADITAAPARRATELTVRMPSAPGSKCESSTTAAIDYSNASQGYIMVKYSGSNPKVKLQITGPDKVIYTYTLHNGGYTSFPLTAGSGSYTANIFENISGTSYALALSACFSAKLSSSLSPYLYPNQYVNYSSNSNAVIKGDELAAKASTRLGVVQEVYNYLISNITYDHKKAAAVKSGYTPDVDSTLSAKTGICFDYAALMAAMLRTQDIPTRLEVGYVSGGIYHAWVSVYVPEQGWINGIIKFDGINWSMMDPTFAAGSSVPQNYTTASYSYSVKYLY